MPGSAKVIHLSRDSPISMQRQLAQRLRDAIANGRFKPGDRIPTEPELMRQFDVSRITARQAVERLSRVGLVVRKQGKGTFVAGPVVHHDLLDLRGIYDELVVQGLDPQTRLVDIREAVPSQRIAELLGTGRRKLLHWRRMYVVKGSPFALSSVHLAPTAQRITQDQVGSQPTYAILEGILGLRVNRAEMTIRYQRASTELQRLLGISRNAPLMVLERVSYSSDGVAREHTLYYAKAEAYEFSLTVRGKLPITRSLKRAG